MTSILFSRVSFAFHDAAPILEDVSFQLSEGWTGLVGENGSGKTTLLGLISGRLSPDSGTVALRPKTATLTLCPQEIFEPDADLFSFEQLQDGESARLKGLLDLGALPLERWPTLSPGERKRWQLAAALSQEPDILLLDEPTNHVDAATRSLLLDALCRFHGLGIVVSHDREFLDALTQGTLRIGRGHVQLYEAPYSVARPLWESEVKAAWDERRASQEEVRRAEARLFSARRTRDTIERSQSGRGRKPKDSDSRALPAKTRKSWAENRKGADVHRLRNAVEKARHAVSDVLPEAIESNGDIFVGYERAPRPTLMSLEVPELRAGETVVLQDVCVHLTREARVRLVGSNGAGKTTLLKAMLRASTLPSSRILYLPQEFGPSEGKRLLGEIRSLEPSIRGRVLSLLARLGSDPARLLASIDPSPGEIRKLALALGLGRHCWLLLLDEPTNHLDLPTVEKLEAALESFPGAVLFISHDEAFGHHAAKEVWRIEGHTVALDVLGVRDV